MAVQTIGKMEPMSSLASVRRPRCSLSAVNGNLHALVLTVEGTLEAFGHADLARAFRDEVATHLDDADADYRAALDVVRRYVELS